EERPATTITFLQTSVERFGRKPFERQAMRQPGRLSREVGARMGRIVDDDLVAGFHVTGPGRLTRGQADQLKLAAPREATVIILVEPLKALRCFVFEPRELFAEQ